MRSYSSRTGSVASRATVEERGEGVHRVLREIAKAAVGVARETSDGADGGERDGAVDVRVEPRPVVVAPRSADPAEVEDPREVRRGVGGVVAVRGSGEFQ